MHQLARLGEPFREQAVRVDLYQPAPSVSFGQSDGQFLSERTAQRGLARPWGAVKEYDSVPGDDVEIHVGVREEEGGVDVIQ